MSGAARGGPLLRGATLQLAANALRFGVIAAAGIVLARLLSPVEFGIWAIAASVLSLAESVRGFGYLQAILVHPSPTEQLLRSSTLDVRRRLVAAYLLLVAIAGVGTLVYPRVPLVELVAVAGVGVVLSGLSVVAEARLQRAVQLRAVAAGDVGATLVGSLLAIAIAWSGGGVWAFVAQYVCVASVRSALIVLGVRRLQVAEGAGKAAAPASVHGADTAERALAGVRAYSGRAIRNQLALQLGRVSDRLVVGAGLPTASLGLYDVAQRWTLHPSEQVFTPLSAIAIATLGRALRGPRSPDTAMRLRATLSLPLVMTCGAAVVLALEAPTLATIVLGDQWTPVIPIVRALSLGTVGASLVKLARWLAFATDQVSRQGRHALAAAPLLATVAMLTVSEGVVIVALALGVSSCVVGGAMFHDIGRRAGFSARELAGIVARPLGCAGAGWGAGLLAHRFLAHGRPGVALSAMCAGLTVGVIAATWFALPDGRSMLAALQAPNALDEERSPPDGMSAVADVTTSSVVAPP
ncbi:MAG: oligosaccharide flippase family protein [Gemmatimonadaceae bacterium]|nr:oligosaccharide flippase family protein [Gemmatimonadaceae bacterium]